MVFAVKERSIGCYIGIEKRRAVLVSSVAGVNCAACAGSVEKAVKRLPAIQDDAAADVLVNGARRDRRRFRLVRYKELGDNQFTIDRYLSATTSSAPPPGTTTPSTCERTRLGGFLVFLWLAVAGTREAIDGFWCSLERRVPSSSASHAAPAAEAGFGVIAEMKGMSNFSNQEGVGTVPTQKLKKPAGVRNLNKNIGNQSETAPTRVDTNLASKQAMKEELEVVMSGIPFHHHNNVDKQSSKKKNKRKRKKVEEEEEKEIVKKEKSTVSIAVAASIIDNTQSLELATRLAGQVARAATIFCIDEVVVFDNQATPDDDSIPTVMKNGNEDESSAHFLVRILRYLDTPQYLRRRLFPMHKSLRFVGLLPPLDAPHHVRKHEWSPYREGVTLDESCAEGTLVDVGLSKHVVVEQVIEPGKRVTVAMGTNRNIGTACLRKIVSPSSPREEMGKYRGYKVRYASSLSTVFNSSPFKGGYDHIIGTSEHGHVINSSELVIPSFRHLLIAFGGLGGLEESIEEDSNLKGKSVYDVFSAYLNTCPHQGSRTIRTEEAILISLQYFQDPIMRAEQQSKRNYSVLVKCYKLNKDFSFGPKWKKGPSPYLRAVNGKLIVFGIIYLKLAIKFLSNLFVHSSNLINLIIKFYKQIKLNQLKE
ncbi:putative methyltransferase C9orf114 [Ananas comosus]|uniref:Putative methyltransferase C9orf114 n=1 Tax=Ananas comosus TaxID=4615 RepID=A0A199W973_ANACO|nr:putative methyltransferase C9orf114 [Ananas comosus]